MNEITRTSNDQVSGCEPSSYVVEGNTYRELIAQRDAYKRVANDLARQLRERTPADTNATPERATHEPIDSRGIVREPFVVKHYAGDERPSIKGNGFDGLEIGEDRQEAEEFIAWINARLAPPPASEPPPDRPTYFNYILSLLDAQTSCDFRAYVERLERAAQPPAEQNWSHPYGYIRSLLSEAVERAEADLMAVGHSNEGPDRTAAMKELENWKAKLQDAWIHGDMEVRRTPQPPVPEWQPIETASHENGFQCIVAVPNYNNKTIKNPPMLVGEAHYIYDESSLSNQGWYWAGEDPTDAHGPGNIYPTHWMPLPSPPTKGEG